MPDTHSTMMRGSVTIPTFNKSFAPVKNLYRLVVFPISNIDPETDSPSATNKESLPFSISMRDKSVMGPCFTDIFTERPFPTLP